MSDSRIERKIYAELVKWKNDPLPKPTLVKGQCQVGKSYIVERFASEEYGNYVLLNFHDDPDTCKLFAGMLEVDHIVRSIEAYTDTKVSGRDT